MALVHCVDFDGIYQLSFNPAENGGGSDYGVPLSPRMTTLPPPKASAYQIPKLIHGQWVLVPDYRFAALCSSEDGAPIDPATVKAGQSLTQLKARLTRPA